MHALAAAWELYLPPVQLAHSAELDAAAWGTNRPAPQPVHALVQVVLTSE